MQFQLFFFARFYAFPPFFETDFVLLPLKIPSLHQTWRQRRDCFFNLFFFALIENNDNKLPKKSLHVHFYCTKNPRPKQARKIWSTSIWPPATRQNPHMNQSQFWPCRLSNRFQKYLTLWALESLCPICQGKNHGFRPSQKERTNTMRFSCFYCCKLSSSLIVPGLVIIMNKRQHHE